MFEIICLELIGQERRNKRDRTRVFVVPDLALLPDGKQHDTQVSLLSLRKIFYFLCLSTSSFTDQCIGPVCKHCVHPTGSRVHVIYAPPLVGRPWLVDSSKRESALKVLNDDQ